MTKKSILVVEDDAELREAVADTLKLGGFKVVTASSGELALDRLAECEIDMVVSDVNMGGMDGIELLETIRQTNSHLPVLIVTAYADVGKAVTAMRLGAVDFMIKPFEPNILIETVKQQIGEQGSIKPIVADPVSRNLYLLAKKVAMADTTVLLLGESGAGKEVVAKFVHEESKRADKPFVAINCAAIPENMLEATMFGHEKGAYTGAHSSRPGKFEQANGGTLLLDEISEMDLGLQAKLLRVLQEREIERLGSKVTRKVDVRVIATTNRNLLDYVKQGKFREDLFYRISVFPLKLESLRDRRGDILPLAAHMTGVYCRRMNRGNVEFDAAASQALFDYDWPGNVRELENVVQRALILQPGTIVHEADLFLDPMASLGAQGENTMFDPCYSANKQVTASDTQPIKEMTSGDNFAQSTIEDACREEVRPQVIYPEESLEQNLKFKEFQMIIDVLKKERGSRSKTAEILGISARTLRYKLAKMRDSGIDLNSELALG